MTAVSAPPESATNAERIRWAFGVLNTHDIAPLRQFWTDATVERFPDRTCTGPDEIAAYFEDTFRAVPDFHMEVRSIVEQGEDVYVHWHLTGTHAGPLFGIEPTGRRVAIDGVDHFVLRDGMVVSNFVVFDRMQWAQQIGMLPPDGSAGDRAAKTAFNLKTRLAERLRRRG